MLAKRDFKRKPLRIMRSIRRDTTSREAKPFAHRLIVRRRSGAGRRAAGRRRRGIPRSAECRPEDRRRVKLHASILPSGDSGLQCDCHHAFTDHAFVCGAVSRRATVRVRWPGDVGGQLAGDQITHNRAIAASPSWISASASVRSSTGSNASPGRRRPGIAWPVASAT